MGAHPWQIRRADAHLRVPWRNGGGFTLEVAHDGTDEREWTWRVSIASVANDGPFSEFVGVDRQLMVIDGNGMRLQVGDDLMVAAPFEVVRFDGGVPTEAVLVDGPVTDLNLMLRGAGRTGRLLIATGPMVVADCHLAVAVAGMAVVDLGSGAIALDHLDAVVELAGRELRVLSGAVAVVHSMSSRQLG